MEKRSLKSTLADFCFSNHAQLELGSPAGGEEQQHWPLLSADQVPLCRQQQWATGAGPCNATTGQACTPSCQQPSCSHMLPHDCMKGDLEGNLDDSWMKARQALPGADNLKVPAHTHHCSDRLRQPRRIGKYWAPSDWAPAQSACSLSSFWPTPAASIVCWDNMTVGESVASSLDRRACLQHHGTMFGQRVSLQHDSRAVLIGSVSTASCSYLTRRPAAREPGLTAVQLQTSKPCRSYNVCLQSSRHVVRQYHLKLVPASTADGQHAGKASRHHTCRLPSWWPNLLAAQHSRKILGRATSIEISCGGLPGRYNSGPGLQCTCRLVTATKELLPEPALPFAKLLNVPGHQKGQSKH